MKYTITIILLFAVFIVKGQRTNQIDHSHLTDVEFRLSALEERLDSLISSCKATRQVTPPPMTTNCFDYSKDSVQKVKKVTYPYTTTYINEGKVVGVDQDPSIQIAFLTQENIRLSQRIDSLAGILKEVDRIVFVPPYRPYGSMPDWVNNLFERMADLENKPYLYIDPKSKQLIAKCPDGSCEIILKNLNY